MLKLKNHVIYTLLSLIAIVGGPVHSFAQSVVCEDVKSDSLPALTPSCPCHAFTWRQTVAPAALLAGACVVRHFDTDVRQFREDHVFDYSNRADDVLQVTPGVFMLGLRAFGVRGKSETWGQLLSATAFSALITAGVTEGLKNTYGRTRPFEIWYHNSFPSGHTFSAFTSATLLHREYGENSVWYSIGGYTMASAIGVSRILNRKHWASDVLGGAALGLVSGNLGYGIAECLFGNPRSGKPSYYGKKPSFLGLSASVSPWSTDIKTLKYVRGEHTSDKDFLGFDHRIGIGYSIKGAYFPFKYLGFGGETTMLYNYFNLDEERFFCEENEKSAGFLKFHRPFKATTYMFMPGIYFSVPLSSRFLLGGNILYGLGETLSFNVDVDVKRANGDRKLWNYIFDEYTYGNAFKAGFDCRYLVSNYLELVVGVNYRNATSGYQFAGYDKSTPNVSNISFEFGASIPLF